MARVIAGSPHKVPKFTTVLVLSASLLALSSCASVDNPDGLLQTLDDPFTPSVTIESPEPDVPSGGEKNINMGETHEGRPEIEIPRTHELPASFPNDSFLLPDEASIFDAGDRDVNSWFLILETDSEAVAKQNIDQIAELNGFSVTALAENKTWLLQNQGMTVEAFLVEEITANGVQNYLNLEIILN